MTTGRWPAQGTRPRRLAALLAGAIVVGGCSGDDGATRGEDGRVTGAGDVEVFALFEGDCVVPPEEVQADVEQVRVVPCEEPHTQEVFALLDYEPAEGESADVYPGDDVLADFAEAACLAPFATYVGIDYLDSELFLTYLLPSLRSWDEADDREVVCIAQSDGTPLDTSVEGTGR